jgi:molybdate transport system ATP-binding protein
MSRFELAFHLSQGDFTLHLDVACEARAVALYGPSGSGKTSALEAIAGLRRPRDGRIAIDDHVLFDHGRGVDVPTRRRRVGYVPQDVLLFPHLDVERNITYAGGGGPTSRLSMLTDVLDLGELLRRPVATLSGGERQRVALARALFAAPQLLLLDEPLAAVDLGRRRRIVEALVRVRDEMRVPIVYVTHMPEEVYAIADVAVLISNGRMGVVGHPRTVLESPSETSGP